MTEIMVDATGLLGNAVALEFDDRERRQVKPIDAASRKAVLADFKTSRPYSRIFGEAALIHARALTEPQLQLARDAVEKQAFRELAYLLTMGRQTHGLTLLSPDKTNWFFNRYIYGSAQQGSNSQRVVSELQRPDGLVVANKNRGIAQVRYYLFDEDELSILDRFKNLARLKALFPGFFGNSELDFVTTEDDRLYWTQ